MTGKEKTQQLASIIKQKLNPLIDNDFVYLDMPSHNNVGDYLIWEATLDFFKQLPFRMIKMTYFPEIIPAINKKHIILLQGGGSLGDIWDFERMFRNRIVRTFPDNKIIIMPQTAHWRNENHLKEDSALFESHPNLTICARDKISYDLLKKHFHKNHILLVPDMAFCLDTDNFRKKPMKPGSSIFINRGDIERRAIPHTEMNLEKNAKIMDWLYTDKALDTMKKFALMPVYMMRAMGIKHIRERFFDYHFDRFVRKSSVQHAFDCITPYEHIHANRMHAAILSVILDKKDVRMYDNNYGKLSSFYDTWLGDVEGVRMMSRLKDDENPDKITT